MRNLRSDLRRYPKPAFGVLSDTSESGLRCLHHVLGCDLSTAHSEQMMEGAAWVTQADAPTVAEKLHTAEIG